MFYVPLENILSVENVNNVGDTRLTLAPSALEHLLGHVTSVFVVSSEGLYNFVALCDEQVILRTDSSPDPT